MTSNLRTEIELRQVYDKVVSFTRTTTGNATILSLYLPAAGTYTESNLKITGTISIIVATGGNNGRIRGTIWGR